MKLNIFALLITTLLFTGCSKENTVAPKKPAITAKKEFKHYDLAHKLIPSLFFYKPKKFMNALEKNHENILTKFTNPDKHPIPVSKSIKNKKLYYTLINSSKYKIGIIKFPRPTMAPEAYYSALIEDKTTNGSLRFRYFTLEKTLSFLTKMNSSVLCEWSRSGSHGNFGIGTKNEPTQEDFIKLIKQQLN